MIARARQLLLTARHEATWQQWVLLLIALVAGLAMRHALAPNFTNDFTYDMKPWVETLRRDGFAALGTNFANYNPPYLYLLYIGTLLPIHYDLTIVKLVADTFDLALASGVGAVAFRLRGRLLLATVAGVATLFIPEVLLNSAFWGQADTTWTTFLVWAFFFLLRRQDTPAWIMYALAFSFKLQALFIFPVMAIAFIVQKHRWRAALWAGIALAATYAPSILAGRSLGSLARIYIDQASTTPELTSIAANLYQWIPQRFFSTVYPAGLYFGLGIVAILCVIYLQRVPAVENVGPWLLKVAAAIAVVVPFVLPEMHDRYFYAGGVLTVICILFDRRYIVPTLILQFTAVCAYSPFLLGTQLLPLPEAAIIQLGAVSWIVYLSLSPKPLGVLAREDPRPGERSERLDVVPEVPAAAASARHLN